MWLASSIAGVEHWQQERRAEAVVVAKTEEAVVVARMVASRIPLLSGLAPPWRRLGLGLMLGPRVPGSRFAT